MILKIGRYFFLTILFLFSITLLSNIIVIAITKSQIVKTNADLPKKFNVLVLGTSKMFASGSENLFYKNRMIATKTLLEISIPDKVILSGSNPSTYYNEPKDMLESLRELGVEVSHFEIDDKGNSTYASLDNYRLNHFGDTLIIITQEFHAYRALLISKQLKINAFAYPAEEVSVDITNKPAIREVFARVKALFDFYFFSS